MKANWIGHIFYRNCLLQLVIEGKRFETRRRGRRRKNLMDDMGKEKVLESEGKVSILLSGELPLEEVMDLS